MTPELDARTAAATDAITTVLSRWTPPSPYRSYSEYQRELAAAYRRRASVFADAISHATAHPGTVPGLLFTALLRARWADEDAARVCDQEALRYERNQAERDRRACHARTDAAAADEAVCS